MKRFTATLLLALACIQSILAVENGDEVALTSQVSGRVLYAVGGAYRVEAFANPDNKPTGFLEIKNSYSIDGDTYVVDRIAADGFRECEKLTKIQTGPECWKIGNNAFYGCTKLNSVTEYESGSISSIGDFAFAYTSELLSLNLPGVHTLGKYVFVKSKIESVNFPKIKNIGDGAFQELSTLSSFSGGELLEAIGNVAFVNCPKLPGITLGPNLTTVGTTAFAFDEKLTEVVVPRSVTLIDQNAYQGIGAETVFILSENFMDFCDKSKLLRNKSITEIYAIPTIVEEINKYLSSGSDENPVEFLTSAKAVTTDNLVELLKVGDSDDFKVNYRHSGITDFHIYDASSGEEITEANNLFSISSDCVRLSYRIGINLLDYDYDITRDSTSGISLPSAGEMVNEQYFTIDGKKGDSSSKGLLIIRNSDGSYSKILKR